MDPPHRNRPGCQNVSRRMSRMYTGVGPCWPMTRHVPLLLDPSRIPDATLGWSVCRIQFSALNSLEWISHDVTNAGCGCHLVNGYLHLSLWTFTLRATCCFWPRPECEKCRGTLPTVSNGKFRVLGTASNEPPYGFSTTPLIVPQEWGRYVLHYAVSRTGWSQSWLHRNQLVEMPIGGRGIGSSKFTGECIVFTFPRSRSCVWKLLPWWQCRAWTQCVHWSGKGKLESV